MKQIDPEHIAQAIMQMCDRHPGKLADYDSDGSDLLIVSGVLNLSIVAGYLNEIVATADAK